MQPLTNLLPTAYLKIAEEVKVPLVHLVRAIALFEEGATVPFLARYRKEATGNMDEAQLRLLEDRLEYFRDLEDRRQALLRSIEEQGKLTAELRARIEAVLDKLELEDLSLPYKPGRKTRGSAAREKGLEPLAEWLWAQQADGRSPESIAETLVNPVKGVDNVDQAVAGARDILAERVSEDAGFRKGLRQVVSEQGVIVAGKSEKADELARQQRETRPKYEIYYDFREPAAKIPSHRVLAIRRGVKEGYLTSEIQVDEAAAIEQILSSLIRDRSSVFAPHLEAAVRDAYSRLLSPAIQADVRAVLKERSDTEAIRVFQENLRNLLLAAPAGAIEVVGLEPDARSGCKVAVVDETGKYLDSAAICATEPDKDVKGGRAVLKDLITKHNARAVAIGNGTGSRETDLFVRAFLRDEKLENVFSIAVNEAGASVYSTSRLAREEFPDLDPAVRGAISIARRLQDPLNELVKVDPKSIGVGQYQHDVDQIRLANCLRATVESCVNRVGVDVNTASFALLRYVSGLNERVAKRIIEYRQNNGRFVSREQLKQVPGFGDRVFQQAAGFLRIRDGENPLDQTAVHPESYPLVEKMAESVGVSVAELLSRPELADQLQLDQFQTDSAGLPTLNDLRDELRGPGRDPREKFVTPHFRDDVLLISDLNQGMELEGIVTNVTNFGAFVDVGVHQDGLVHVSELSDKFIKDPRAAVKVGDIVKVRVLAADAEGKRISLSMKPAPPPKVEKAARPRQQSRPENGRYRKPPEAAKRAEAKAAPPRAPARPGVAKEHPKQSRPSQPKAKPLTLEEKLALLQSKFRTQV